TAKGCPYILRTIEHYAARPISSLMRLIQRFARPAATADAQGLIQAVTQRARVVSRRIAERRGHRLQAATGRGHERLAPHDPVAIRARLGSGHALDEPVRQNMESSFGRNFSAVRTHADETAARLNMEIGARAFAVGQDI